MDLKMLPHGAMLVTMPGADLIVAFGSDFSQSRVSIIWREPKQDNPKVPDIQLFTDEAAVWVKEHCDREGAERIIRSYAADVKQRLEMGLRSFGGSLELDDVLRHCAAKI